MKKVLGVTETMVKKSNNTVPKGSAIKSLSITEKQRPNHTFVDLKSDNLEIIYKYNNVDYRAIVDVRTGGHEKRK